MFHITIECSMAFARWLEDGKVLGSVYAAKNGGINFRSVDKRRWHINNAGAMVARS